MTRLGLEAVTIGRDLFNTAQVSRIIANTLEGVAKDIEIDFKVTTQTWGHKPGFKIQRPSNTVRIIGTGDDIYKYVSGGTRVRFATMTPDFKAKTRVGVIGSGAGRGGVAYIRRDRPRPGIKARKFDLAIAKKWKGLIKGVFDRALASEL